MLTARKNTSPSLAGPAHSHQAKAHADRVQLSPARLSPESPPRSVEQCLRAAADGRWCDAARETGAQGDALDAGGPEQEGSGRRGRADAPAQYKAQDPGAATQPRHVLVLAVGKAHAPASYPSPDGAREFFSDVWLAETATGLRGFAMLGASGAPEESLLPSRDLATVRPEVRQRVS